MAASIRNFLVVKFEMHEYVALISWTLSLVN